MLRLTEPSRKPHGIYFGLFKAIYNAIPSSLSEITTTWKTHRPCFSRESYLLKPEEFPARLTENVFRKSVVNWEVLWKTLGHFRCSVNAASEVSERWTRYRSDWPRFSPRAGCELLDAWPATLLSGVWAGVCAGADRPRLPPRDS